MFIPRDRPSVDEWEYFIFSNHITFHMRPAPGMHNVFEPVLVVRIPLMLAYVQTIDHRRHDI